MKRDYEARSLILGSPVAGRKLVHSILGRELLQTLSLVDTAASAQYFSKVSENCIIFSIERFGGPWQTELYAHTTNVVSSTPHAKKLCIHLIAVAVPISLSVEIRDEGKEMTDCLISLDDRNTS